jgi:large exoprotein involved in heme utilization and adhesion
MILLDNTGTFTFADLAGFLGLDPATATIVDVLGALAVDPFGFGPLLPAVKTTLGNAGTIFVTAPTISVSGQNSAIDSGTAWGIKAPDGTVFGNAGAVFVTGDNVSVSGGGEIRSRSGILNLETGILDVGAGNAGTVTVSANDTLTVTGTNSAISTSTFGDGNGGDVRLNAGNRVEILNDGRVSADSGGTIGGVLHSGAGLGGNITITAGNEIVLDNGQVTTQTLSADGGNITLLAPNLVQLQDSIISTSVQDGVGGGGNINIDPQFVLVNNSSIIANAFGGPGGNITIIANNFLQSATSIIEASSALSTPGVIEVRSPENNVENNIAQLPAAFIDASALLRGLCTARRTGAPSSFTVAGRGGVPVDADGYLPAFGSDVAAAVAGSTGEPQLVFALLANTLDCAR